MLTLQSSPIISYSLFDSNDGEDGSTRKGEERRWFGSLHFPPV